MNIKIEKIKEYLHNHQNLLFVALFSGVIFLLIREIPFLNLYFPSSTPLIAVLITIIILFNLYKLPAFLLGLAFILAILYLFKITQAEQIAILTFVILFILIIDETISFFKEK